MAELCARNEVSHVCQKSNKKVTLKRVLRAFESGSNYEIKIPLGLLARYTLSSQNLTIRVMNGPAVTYDDLVFTLDTLNATSFEHNFHVDKWFPHIAGR